jgi:hypothetical protein
MKSADMLSTFHNKTFYYDIFVGYYSFVRDFENYYKFLNENVKLYNENPTEIKKRRGNYILLIHNHLSGCLYLKKFEEYRKSIEEYKKYIKGLKKLSEYDKLLDILVRKHEILYYNARGEFYDGVEFITSYMPELNKVVDVFDQRELNFIYYSSAMNYFGAGKYKEAQYYLNLILNSGEPDQRKELFLSSKLMSIIINYELENTEYLDSLIRSTYRYLMSRKIEYKFENFVISFFKRVLNKITKDELFELFDESIYKINKLMKDPYEVSGAIYFDYVSWLESKLNNKEYGDIVREKALKHK